MPPESETVVKELNSTELFIQQPLRGGGLFSMVCNKTGLTLSCQKVSASKSDYHFDDIDYQLRITDNMRSCQPLKNVALRLDSTRLEKLISPFNDNVF